MKRQMKIAAVVSATALLAIGASFTSMAAAKTGNWVPEDGTWYAYDKNGKMIKDEFVLHNGLEFYVGEDGALVTEEWVEHEGDMYFINKDGLRTTNIWRELTPYEDPEADEEWYWFDAAGKRAESESVEIGDETFYFDHEGRVLYGWVDEEDFENAEVGELRTDLVYTNERGALVTADWVETLPAGEVDGDEFWYYLGSNGNPVRRRQNDINGETYFFNEDGQMLDGFVALLSDDTYASADPFTLSDLTGWGATIYYASENSGRMYSNQWILAEETGDANGSDEYYFWIKKNGEVLVPEAEYAATQFDLVDGYAVNKYDTTAIEGGVAFEKINNEYYAFNVDGEMQSGLIEINNVEAGDDTAWELYYFGAADDGAMKTGLQKITDAELETFNFFFGTENDDGYEKGVAVTGAANGYLYINGIVAKADEFKYEYVEGVVTNLGTVNFIVDVNGKIQTYNKLYEDDGVAIVCTDDDCWTNDVEFSKEAGVLKGSTTSDLDVVDAEEHAEAEH